MNSGFPSAEQNLTQKQRAIYRFVQRHIEDHSTPPSLREIGTHFGLSVGTVQDQIEAIRKKGLLHKQQSKARGLRLPISAMQVPILGRVHAGPLHQAFENVEGHVPVGSAMAPSQHFGLRVCGDSMINAGILEDDIVLVRAQESADDGDIVVARIEDETTVKTFRRRDGRVYLVPENPAYAEIHAPFSLIGVVVELRRHYKR